MGAIRKVGSLKRILFLIHIRISRDVVIWGLHENVVLYKELSAREGGTNYELKIPNLRNFRGRIKKSSFKCRIWQGTVPEEYIQQFEPTWTVFCNDIFAKLLENANKPQKYLKSGVSLYGAYFKTKATWIGFNDNHSILNIFV